MTDTKPQTGESTGQTSHSFYERHSWVNKFVFLVWLTGIFLDWAWSTAAVHIGYYESNPFTNWLAQYVGIDISLSIHALLIIGLVMIANKLQEFDKITYWTFHILACFMAVWWMMNNMISYIMLTTI